MKDYIVVSLYGQKAVNRAYAIQNGKCYTDISGENGRKITQLEATVNEPGTYNGLVQKWVDVTIVDGDLETTLSKLAEIGFSGTWALVELQRENGCFLETISDPVFLQI